MSEENKHLEEKINKLKANFDQMFLDTANTIKISSELRKSTEEFIKANREKSNKIDKSIKESLLELSNIAKVLKSYCTQSFQYPPLTEDYIIEGI